MNRIPLIFAFCLGFGSFGIHSSAAQYAPKPPISPQLPSTVTAQPSPTAAPKPSATQPGRPTVAGPSKPAKEPEQMKIVRLYRGQGYFDAGLAEKLRPTLAKAFGVMPASGSKPGDSRSSPPDLLHSVFGQKEDSEKTADQNAVAKNGQP